jgi:bacterioferritin-associated ferredoxin
MKVSFRHDAGAGEPLEPMIICECTGTTDTTVREIARDGARTVAEVTRRCGAGGGCQSCRPYIVRILRTVAAKEAATTGEPEAATTVEPEQDQAIA